MRSLIAMSGGVDSSVAAYLMKSKGYECVGVTMRLHRNETVEQGCPDCCSQRDTDDAGEVALALGIPYEILDYTVDFRKHVIEKFIDTYEKGGTPNPCIDCNRYIKFEKLLELARERGIDVLATGHYVRNEYDEKSGRYLLKKARDLSKDQSYVLYTLTQQQLAHIVFPLGDKSKPEVRKIAENQGFANSNKRDSQDICFVPDGDYVTFMEKCRGKNYPGGDFVDTEGNVLGRHKGIVRYTVGQRKGLGISSSAPLYVTGVDPIQNTVTLSHGEKLFSKTVYAKDINLISVPGIKTPLRVKAKIRYSQKEQPATVVQEGELLKVEFDEPQRAATVGQSVVLYDGDIVVGGGVICKAEA